LKKLFLKNGPRKKIDEKHESEASSRLKDLEAFWEIKEHFTRLQIGDLKYL